MIFSKFFKKKKHLSEKVSDRIVAIAELDGKDSSSKSILHELAFNDGDDKVRRAALEKLNDFALYWQAFKKDSSAMIKKLSEKALVENLVGERDSNLDAKLKKEFVHQCNKSQLLEQVVFKLGDETLIEHTLIKLDKEPLLLQAIHHPDLPNSLKSKILDSFNEVNQLKKLAKKLSGELLAQVEQKLEDIKVSQELPVKLEKQVRLLLAQFNALKDKSDVAYVEAQIAEIEHQWQQADLSMLAPTLEQELKDKYQTIGASLQRILAPKKAEWLAQQKQNELEAQQANTAEALSQQLLSIESKITQSIVDGKEIDQDKLTQDLTVLEQAVSQANVSDESRSSLLTRAQSLINRANELPLIKAGIDKAKVLVTELESLNKPEDLPTLNEMNAEFKRIKGEWKDNLKQVDIAMPASLDEQYKGMLDALQTEVSELEKQQRHLFNQTRRKMSELEHLIDNGKFHSAFGLFKKLGFWMAELNSYQTNQLERKWQSLNEAIDKLHDLERSFSNPKKQELIDDIRKIAEQPLVDPSEQAHRVRLLRSNWQSLGHADDEQETALNQEFDALCEQAFTPCREHYKELEDERQANYDSKILIIEQLEVLADKLASSEVSDWRSIESLFVKLNKLWRETGLVDREKVAEVNQRFQAATKPVRARINKYHNDNEDAKRALIQQAKDIAEGEGEIQVKTDELKLLQNKWRDIGFAGSKLDQKLWTEFRAVNNPIFELRDNNRKTQQAQAKVQAEAFFTQFNEIKAKLSETQVVAELRTLAEQAESIFGSVSGLPKAEYEKLRKESSAIKADIEAKVKQSRKQQENKSFTELFSAVEAIANGQSADLTSLKPAWQTAINSNNKDQRSLLTLQIEITANLNSPETEQAQRNETQMQMLSAKLEQGEDYSLQDLLEKWLAAGIFAEQDIQMLERIKPAYL